MTDTTTTANAANSLLDELEELEVLEAEELQEGVAFHAFRFAAPALMGAMLVTLDTEAATVVELLDLPQGTTLLDVEGDKLHIVFDVKAVDAQLLQDKVNQSLAGKIVSLQYNEADRYKVTKL